MSTLLKSAALVLCAGVSCAHTTETAKQWEFNIGAMYEIENVEKALAEEEGAEVLNWKLCNDGLVVNEVSAEAV